VDAGGGASEATPGVQVNSLAQCSQNSLGSKSNIECREITDDFAGITLVEEYAPPLSILKSGCVIRADTFLNIKISPSLHLHGGINLRFFWLIFLFHTNFMYGGT